MSRCKKDKRAMDLGTNGPTRGLTKDQCFALFAGDRSKAKQTPTSSLDTTSRPRTSDGGRQKSAQRRCRPSDAFDLDLLLRSRSALLPAHEFLEKSLPICGRSAGARTT